MGIFDVLGRAAADLWGPGEPRQETGVMNHLYTRPDLALPPREPPPEEVVYLGINSASREREKAAFAGAGNATFITGSGDNEIMNGLAWSTDGDTLLDLGEPEDIARFLDERGISDVRTDALGKPTETFDDAQRRADLLADLFIGGVAEDGAPTGLEPGMRDEMAQLLEVLHGVEAGERRMDRLVVSGHSYGKSIFSETGEGVAFEDLGTILEQFPAARHGVEHLMLSACHTLEEYEGDGSDPVDNSDGSVYKDLLPGLRTVFGYDGKSPSGDQNSARHIERWLRSSDGRDPEEIAEAAGKLGSRAAKVIEFDE